MDRFVARRLLSDRDHSNDDNDSLMVVVPRRTESSAAEKTLPIVALRNRATGKVLEHFNGASIHALDDDERHPYHQWRRVPTTNGFVAYRNVATGMVLDHYGGHAIEAFNDDVHDHHHQWREVGVGSGFVALRNRATGKVLGHWYGESIRAPTTDVHAVNHQWQVCTVTLASTVVALRNRATRKVLEHVDIASIEALADDEAHSKRQWHRIDIQNGYVAYLNVASGMVLDHYGGRAIHALTADFADRHHQWREIDVGGGFVAIQNRATGKLLEHWYGESIQAPSDLLDHLNHHWRVLGVPPLMDHPDDEWEDSILLDDGPLGETMLVVLPEPMDLEESGMSSSSSLGRWSAFSFPSVHGSAFRRRHFSVGTLLHRHSISSAVRLLTERFSDVARYIALGEATSEIDAMYPLFRPLPHSNGVQLFAHHDIVLTLVQLVDHYRTSRDVFAAILSWLGTSLIRDNGDHTKHDGLRAFLRRPMAPVIEASLLSASRSAELPTEWTQFVPLPRSDQFQAIDRETKRPYCDQTMPLDVWELVLLFFRIIEAKLQIEHGATLARFSLRYNAVFVAPRRDNTAVAYNEFSQLRNGTHIDVLRPRGAPDKTPAGMWHVLTFRDTDLTSPNPIGDFSVAFVLHASDPNAVLVANPRGRKRQPCTFEPLATANNAFDLSRHAKYVHASYYHLLTLPGGVDAVERWINQRDADQLVTTPLLGANVYFLLDPEAVNGLETVDLDERQEDDVEGLVE